MKYRRDYQETHDIDWFFRYRGKIYHAASNGGMLPDIVDSRKNRELQEKLEDIVGTFEIEYAGGARNRINAEDLSSFAEYAAKGFISLDRVETAEDNNSNHYQIVAFPKNREQFENEDLIGLMPVLNGDAMLIE